MNKKVYYKDFASLLERIFKEHLEKNPSFSLRSFAYLLGINSGTLSQYLQRKKIPSVKTMKRIGKILNLSDVELLPYITTVKEKDLYRTIELSKKRSLLFSDIGSIILILLPKLKDFRADDNWIIKKTGFPLSKVQKIKKKLVEAELLTFDKNNNWIEDLSKWSKLNSKTKEGRKAICMLHDNIFSRLMKRYNNSENDIYLSSTFMRIKNSDRLKIRQKLIEFERELVAEFEDETDGDDVYSLTCFLDNYTQSS